MCYCIGVYLITMIQLQYREPRPFWVNTEIETPIRYCPLDYAMPSQGTFNIIFFMSYSAYMKLYKYKRPEFRNLWMIYLTFIAIGTVEVIYIIFLAMYGLTFFYQ